jgi:hypothetical protein
MHAQIGTELSLLRAEEILDRARRERRGRRKTGSSPRRPIPEIPSE